MRIAIAVPICAALLACAPSPIQLTAGVVAGIAATTVADGVFGKVIFDPVWEFFVGKPGEAELKTLKNDFIKEATKSIVESIIPSANAADGGYTCERGEELSRCQYRVAEAASLGFDAYAPKFVAAWRTCRDDIVLTPVTGALDYTEQVRKITECIGERGFQREVAVIIAHVQRRT